MESYETKEVKWEDTFNEDMKEISHLNSERYLGQILSSDSKNTKNIDNLKNKGIGLKNKIVQILSNIPGGPYHFELAMVFRNAYLLSSMLSNSEVWYGITKAEIHWNKLMNACCVRYLSVQEMCRKNYFNILLDQNKKTYVSSPHSTTKRRLTTFQIFYCTNEILNQRGLSV